METDLAQKAGPRENLGSSKTNVLESALNQSRANHVREQIRLIANTSHRENLISDETYEGYQELAEGRDGKKITLEQLESMRDFAKEHELGAFRIHNKIQAAKQKKIASEVDEEYLMGKWVIENMKFVSQASSIEAQIDAKLMRMQKDRERYDKLAHHELIEESGQLNVDGNTKIDFPDEKEFLEMTVPERRERLKELEEALPKAEAYAEISSEGESGKRVEAYVKKLDKAARAGIIGEHTYNRFLGEFMELDSEKEQERWNSEFDAQMKRYRVLWVNIRSTLKGEALDQMEGMIDEHGYSDLFKTFGLLKESESKRLVGSYAVALEQYRKEGAIGRHTMTQFMLWMNQRDLADQYEAEDLLPGEMERYENLWEDISQLSGKKQKFLRSKIDVWGYTELKNQYNAFTGQGPANDNASDQLLSQVQSGEVRKAIVETNEMLEEQGGNKRKSFIDILGHMFNRANRSSFDASSFETELRNRVVQENPDIEDDPKGRGADDEVDFNQIDEDADLLEDGGQSKVIDDTGFIQVESRKDDGSIHRETQVTMNEEDGLKNLFTQNNRQNYRAEEEGGKDGMSLAAYSSGHTVELDLEETRITKKYLELKEKEQKEESQVLDEAA